MNGYNYKSFICWMIFFINGLDFIRYRFYLSGCWGVKYLYFIVVYFVIGKDFFVIIIAFFKYVY